MKLKTIIKGGKVHEVGYRFFLFTKAMELGCAKFFAKNESDSGIQIVVAIIEGDELQSADFMTFAQSHHPEGSDVADIAFEDYSGPIMSTDAFLHFFTADQLNKGIPALLRIDCKQDKIIEKLDETRADIVSEIRASREEVAAKLDENREAIIGEIGEQKETLDDRLKRIENDIYQLKAKVGI